jgi:hypothetical protein
MKPFVRILGILAEVRTEPLQDIEPENYRCSILNLNDAISVTVAVRRCAHHILHPTDGISVTHPGSYGHSNL